MTDVQAGQLLEAVQRLVLIGQFIAFLQPVILGVILFLCYKIGRK